jgi:hypothetical protein
VWKSRNYRIIVKGHLEERCSERLAGMRLTTSSGGDQAPVSILEGLLVDQAELSGVLNTLNGWRFSILSVEVLADDPSGSPDNGTEP